MFVPTLLDLPHERHQRPGQVTHDPSDRLSYYLFAEVTEKRPNYAPRPGGHEGRLPPVSHEAADRFGV